ncbi:hypothetical protein [Metabacillus litoralis]|uniref:hypothetical protein n=1 Tax=Metabacillus litoralis TaxID=152268 RepID=UPI001CFF28CD|nr:hypothetical protein [Metabacillus litoralis]
MKWKNYGLWVSIASVLYMILKDLGLQIDLTNWETYVTSILGILVTLGIISNPESGRGFFNARTSSKGNNIPSPTTTAQVSGSVSDVYPNTASGKSNSKDQLKQIQSLNNQEASRSEELMPDRKYAPYEK